MDVPATKCDAAVVGRNNRAVTLHGMVHALRDLGGVTFLTLRTREGLVQCVCPRRPEGVREECAVSVSGVLRPEPRAPGGAELAETRTNVVFGEGARDAEVMFIGEGPGEQEDRTGRPFVGRAGQLLDDMLAMIDLKREKVFIGNMVKCRPPQNRDPLNIEQEACIGYLRNQVALLKPKIIVCLGRIAAMKLIKEDFKITREHGQWIEKAGVWMMAMYHPSALLRDPRKRPESFEDLKSLQAKIREVCVRTY